MIWVVIVYLYLVSIALLWYMLRQFVRGTHELLSVRNFAILGFIVFQTVAAAGTLRPGQTKTEFLLRHPLLTSSIYAVMVTVFIFVFIWGYRRTRIASWLAAKTPVTRAAPSDALLWMLAIVLVVLAAALRFSVNIPLVSVLAHSAGVAFASAACGIVGWLWAPRFFNPLVIASTSVICIVAAAIVVTGSFGRRTLLAIGAALLWGMYYSHLRYAAPKTAILRIGMVAIVPIVAMALFTSARHAGVSGDNRRSAAEHLQAIRHDAELGAGLKVLFSGQGTAMNSLWLLEQYPGKQFETRPFFTLYYLAILPVPRTWWAEKPYPITTLLPHMAGVHGVNRDRLKLSVGIIGHAAAEGRWYALLVYAGLGGLFIRYLDEVVQRNALSPLIVVAFGASFGQVVGFARGDTSLFVTLFIIGVTATYLTMLVIGKLLEHISGAATMTYLPDVPDEYDSQWADDDDALALDSQDLEGAEYYGVRT